MIFKYTHIQKNGKVSYAYVNLDDVINARLIKVDEEVEGTTVEKEGFFLDTKHKVQTPMEVPIEQPRTKEDKAMGQRNISHSKWELGWSLYTITIQVPEEVEQLKAYYESKL